MGYSSIEETSFITTMTTTMLRVHNLLPIAYLPYRYGKVLLPHTWFTVDLTTVKGQALMDEIYELFEKEANTEDSPLAEYLKEGNRTYFPANHSIYLFKSPLGGAIAAWSHDDNLIVGEAVIQFKNPDQAIIKSADGWYPWIDDFSQVHSLSHIKPY